MLLSLNSYAHPQLPLLVLAGRFLHDSLIEVPPFSIVALQFRYDMSIFEVKDAVRIAGSIGIVRNHENCGSQGVVDFC